jgi:hypothetical protein
MTLHRIQVKYFVQDPSAVHLPDVVPVFHRWIQERAVDGLLIDVADYKHVPNGPGIMLIGHEADYGLDLGRGRPGLLYTRKRDVGLTLRESLRTAIQQTLIACCLLENEAELDGRLVFPTDELEIAFADRLRLPNTPASVELVRDDLTAVLAALYGEDADVRIESLNEDPRRLLTLRIRVSEAPDLGDLVQRVETQYA